VTVERARARLGLAVVGVLALVAASADLLASDLPLVCRRGGHWYFLPNLVRPRALDGVDNQTLDGPSARDAWSLRPPVPYGPEQQHPGGVTAVLAPPSRAHWLGTDDRGRDVLARLIHGTRVALIVGPLSVALALAIGLAIGLGTIFGGTIDLVLGRVTEVGLTFPTLLLLLAIQGLTATTSLGEVALAIALSRWPHVARLTRAEVLRIAASPHVEAARGLGAGWLRIAVRHVLPLALTPALVFAAFGVGQAVLFESALTFLGFGVPPPTASWGELLQQAQASGLRWWLLAPPTVAIATLVLACNLIGDGLRASGNLEA
jgi:peptide/nickel transport system permease protein